ARLRKAKRTCRLWLELIDHSPKSAPWTLFMARFLILAGSWDLQAFSWFHRRPQEFVLYASRSFGYLYDMTQCTGMKAAVLALWVASALSVYGDDLSPRKEPGDWSKTLRDVKWADLKGSIQKNQLGEAKSLGHDSGQPYREVPARGAILVGFDCSMSPFKKSPQTVRGITPVFLTQDGLMTGTVHGAEKGKLTLHPLVAKPGYAVAKVTGKFDGTAMRQIKVRFEKISGTHLDPKDAYESPWVGTYDKSLVTEDASDTSDNLPIGITGGSGWGLDRLRLVFLSPQ
ncbi:MAG: serine protease, partial [Verrucomicrobiaceae bacterium]|nr:serine protease [Verrucomicrobiaceae bacterium]